MTGWSICFNVISTWYTSVCSLVNGRDICFKVIVIFCLIFLPLWVCLLCLSVVVSSGINSFVYLDFWVYLLHPFVSVSHLSFSHFCLFRTTFPESRHVQFNNQTLNKVIGTRGSSADVNIYYLQTIDQVKGTRLANHSLF